MSRLINLYELAKKTGRTVQECLYIAQEANAVKMQPGDANIFIDSDIFQMHLEKIIDKEVEKFTK